MDRMWTCTRCQVTVTFPPSGQQPPSPTGWARCDGEWRCLGCRRQQVAESASAGTGSERSKRRRRALTEFAPLAIGLTLTLIHLVTIPVTNTSVNPARSTGPALYAGGWAMGQLWLFWLAPLVGAAIAGATYHSIVGGRAKAAARGPAT